MNMSIEYLWNDTIQIPESVDVGITSSSSSSSASAIVALIENLLCGIPLVLMFPYSLKNGSYCTVP
jgi:hypothetical protein